MAAPRSVHVISTAGPNEQEILHGPSLEAWNKKRTEPLEESNRRQKVLTNLSNLCKQWIKTVMITEFRMQPEMAEEVGGRIFTTGSYRYNVHTSGSDIDVILIAPDKISIRHFFTSLVERLEKEPWVSDMAPTEDASVPIIAMRCDGIDIDLSFGVIKKSRFPDNIDMLDDNILRGLDEKSVRSVNAVRVAQLLIDAVPNKAPFRQLLRFVKSWAKARGLYSSKFGYPTGIGWAILSAKVCQCFPNLNAAGLIVRFFKFYSTWFKPEPTAQDPNRAIYLMDSLTPKAIIPGVAKVWDPKTNFKDAQALFPIMTPAYPWMNSCYNVTRSNLRRMCEEFKRGHLMLSSMIEKPLNPALGENGIWTELLEPFPFLTSFSHYLYVKVATTTYDSYTRWTDSAEAKLRFLWIDHHLGKKGVAMENYPQFKVQVFSQRYEDPEQKKFMDQKREEALEKSQQVRPGATQGSNSQLVEQSPLRRQGSAAFESSGGPAIPEQFTAHYMFGLELVKLPEGQAQKKIQLTAVAEGFRDICKTAKEYKPGVTKVPEVTVVDKTQMPDWLKDEGAKNDPVKKAEAAAAAAAAAAASAAAAAAEAATREPATPATVGDSQQDVDASRGKRQRDEDQSEGNNGNGATTAAATDPPVPDAGDGGDDTLGMDF